MLSNKQYFALKASLPYLKFGETPFLSRERFMEYCEVFLGKKELEYLQKISLHGSGEKAAAGSTEAKFSSFETALRNALVTFRAKKKGIICCISQIMPGFSLKWGSHKSS